MVAVLAMVKAMGAMGKIKGKQWLSMHKGLKGVKDNAGTFTKLAESLGALKQIGAPFAKILDMMGKMLQGALAPAIQKLFDVLFSPEITSRVCLKCFQFPPDEYVQRAPA